MPRLQSKIPVPTLEHERRLLKAGFGRIAGVDEAGRGSVFGPVCVGMVVLPLDDLTGVAEALSQVRDSKKLYRPKVYRLADEIKEMAWGWGVGHGSAAEVDQFGIVSAIKLAAERALAELEGRLRAGIEYLLTDSRMPTPAGFSNDYKKALVHGDAECLSIACAAMLAKQYHDVLVRELAEQYAQGYQLNTNVGYGTAAHLRAIQELGPTPHHRHSFRPIAQHERP
jgi:ribonuclease HII